MLLSSQTFSAHLLSVVLKRKFSVHTEPEQAPLKEKQPLLGFGEKGTETLDFTQAASLQQHLPLISFLLHLHDSQQEIVSGRERRAGDAEAFLSFSPAHSQQRTAVRR